MSLTRRQLSQLTRAVAWVSIVVLTVGLDCDDNDSSTGPFNSVAVNVVGGRTTGSGNVFNLAAGHPEIDCQITNGLHAIAGCRDEFPRPVSAARFLFRRSRLFEARSTAGRGAPR